MPRIRQFDLWFMDYVTDGGRTHPQLPFRTQQETAGTLGNVASSAVNGQFGWTARLPEQPCVGGNECVTPRKLICVLPTGQSYGVPVPARDLIAAGIQTLVAAGCICVHLEGEEITDPLNNLI